MKASDLRLVSPLTRLEASETNAMHLGAVFAFPLELEESPSMAGPNERPLAGLPLRPFETSRVPREIHGSPSVPLSWRSW